MKITLNSEELKIILSDRFKRNYEKLFKNPKISVYIKSYDVELNIGENSEATLKPDEVDFP